MYETKLNKLKKFMAAGDHTAALRLANSFGQLGPQKEAITRAWAALQNPEFYRAIGRPPEALIATGLAAIRERYGLPAPAG